MAIIEIIKRHAKSLFSVLLLTIFSPLTYAFELLSEGAMDSVSVRSGPIFDSRQSGSHRDEGYEQLPFDISQEASVTATDEVSLELDFVLVQEVESWANNVRDNVGALFEVSTIDALPGAEPFDLKIYLEHSGIETLDVIGDDSGDISYQRGDHSHTTNVYDASRNSITVEHTSYIERAATINSDPYQDGSSFGDTFLTGIRASSWHRTTQRD